MEDSTCAAGAVAWIVLCALAWLAAVKAWTLMRASALRTSLRARGFTSLDLWGAEHLVLALGGRAWRIPGFDEVGSLPGVDASDLRSLVRFMRANA